jgi:hypothetical protein
MPRFSGQRRLKKIFFDSEDVEFRHWLRVGVRLVMKPELQVTLSKFSSEVAPECLPEVDVLDSIFADEPGPAERFRNGF